MEAIFAGGIHDARSAAMVAAATAPLTARGGGVGLLMGTAYLFTEELGETMRLSSARDFGNVAVNNVDAGIINAPYGGRRESGFGSEHGREGLEGYLQLKHVRIRHTH